MASGTNPDWNFPRRRCDDCNSSYKPTRPNSRYCSKTCRDAHHRHGGAYRKLRGEVRKLAERELAHINAELRELRQLWNEVESNYVTLKNRIDLLSLQHQPGYSLIAPHGPHSITTVTEPAKLSKAPFARMKPIPKPEDSAR